MLVIQAHIIYSAVSMILRSKKFEFWCNFLREFKAVFENAHIEWGPRWVSLAKTHKGGGGSLVKLSLEGLFNRKAGINLKCVPLITLHRWRKYRWNVEPMFDKKLTYFRNIVFIPWSMCRFFFFFIQKCWLKIGIKKNFYTFAVVDVWPPLS